MRQSDMSGLVAPGLGRKLVTLGFGRSMRLTLGAPWGRSSAPRLRWGTVIVLGYGRALGPGQRNVRAHGAAAGKLVAAGAGADRAYHRRGCIGVTPVAFK